MYKWTGLDAHDTGICLKALHWDCETKGLLCKLKATQQYHNASEKTLEVTYTFAVPHSAVVTEFAATINDKRLVAQTMAAPEADDKYDEAIESGDMPAMLEHAENGMCTANIGSLKPHESVDIEITYCWLLKPVDRVARIAIPTVIAPRYSRDGSQGGLLPHQQIEHDFRIEYPVSAHFEFKGAMFAHSSFSVGSSSVTYSTTEDAVVFDISKEFADHDLVVTISDIDIQPQALLVKTDDSYRGLVVSPAPVSETEKDKPIHLKVLVDCSGSMSGASIEEAKKALNELTSELRKRDRISLFRFGSHTEALIGRPTEVSPTFFRREYKPIVETIEADLGGTEIRLAIDTVITDKQPADILLITDGDVWDELDLVALYAQHVRLFVIGVGHAANEHWCRNVAQKTLGACEMVTPYEDMDSAVLRMVRRMRLPSTKLVAATCTDAFKVLTDSQGVHFAGESVAQSFVFNRRPRHRARLTFNTTQIELPDWTEVQDENLLKVLIGMELRQAQRDNDTVTCQSLATQYGLLTPSTKMILVAEREADQKATAMPSLQRIPQMQEKILTSRICCSSADTLSSMQSILSMFQENPLDSHDKILLYYNGGLVLVALDAVGVQFIEEQDLSNLANVVFLYFALSSECALKQPSMPWICLTDDLEEKLETMPAHLKPLAQQKSVVVCCSSLNIDKATVNEKLTALGLSEDAEIVYLDTQQP